jgi:lysophospholipase L1-like esterase
VIRTLRTSTIRLSIVGVGLLLWAGCSGHRPTAPTPTLAVVCPANVSARAGVDAIDASVTYSSPTATGGKAPLSTTCSPNSGSSFPVGSTPVSCTTTDAAGDRAECAFAVSIDPAPVPQLTYTKYLGFGDSETEGKVRHAPLELMANSYTIKLQTMLQTRYSTQSIVVADDGYGGQQAVDPATLARFDAALARETPQVVFILDGANDLLARQTAAIGPAITAIAVLGQHATDHGVQVFLATLPPMNPDLQGSSNANAVPPFNTQLANLAALRNYTLVDINGAFHGDLGLIGSDGLHPTDAGYQVIAQAFYDKIVALYETAPTTKLAFRR